MFGTIFAICIGIGLPLGGFIYAVFKKRYIPFVLGVLAFIVSQVLIRIPLLDYLQAHSSSYAMFSVTNPLLFVTIIGLSAGVFEEVARFIMMYYFMKLRDWQSGFLFGLGHGGIEAVLFVGIGALALLFSPTVSAYGTDFVIGGVERLFAMILHIGLSIIVLRGVVEKRFIYVVIAILIHGFVDILVGILPLVLSPNDTLITVEVTLAIVALAVFGYSLLIKRRGVL